MPPSRLWTKFGIAVAVAGLGASQYCTGAFAYGGDASAASGSGNAAARGSGNTALASASDDGGVNRPVRDKWALVVGIGAFADPRYNLKYSAKDAQDFAAYLVNEAGFAKDHVKVILDQDATYRRIRSELGNRWLPRVANPDDLVVLYFSTHGSGADLDVGGDNYLLASDTDVNDLYATGLSMRTLASDIKQRVHCDRIVIFLDACHSGGLTAAGTGAKGLFRSGVDAQEFSAGSGQLVIASSKDNQASWESKKLSNGVFTSSLLEVLRNQGANATIGSVFSALKDQVQDTVLRERGVLQTPVLSSQWKGTDLRLAAEPVHRHPGLSDDEDASVIAMSKAPSLDGMVPPETIASVTIPSAPAAQPSSPPASPHAPSAVATTTATKVATVVPPTVPPKTPPTVPPTAPPAAPQVPTGPPTSRTLLIPGVSVGRINLGMSKTEALELLGKPASTTADTVTYWAGKSYFLCLKFSGNNLAQVAFSSPFFRTLDGVGLATYAANQSKFKTETIDPQFIVRTYKSGGLSIVSSKSEINANVALLHKGELAPTSLSWIPLNTSVAPTTSVPATSSVPTNTSATTVSTAAATTSSASSTAANAPSSSTLVVPGVAIAKARLGMSRAEVLALLGKPNGGEKNNVLAYLNGTGAKRYFLAVRIVDGAVTDIAYSSPAFGTANGIKVTTFSNRLSEFEAPVKDVSSAARIYTLKNGGGLSMVDRGGAGARSAFGWLHAAGVKSNSIDWLPQL